MVVLGLLLVILAGGLAAGVVLSNTDPVVASAFGVSLSNVSVGGLFLVGAATGLVFTLGLVIAVAGAGRRRGKRRRLKAAVADERDQREALAQQNAALQEQLGQGGTGASSPVSSTTDAVSSPRHAASDDDEADRFPR